MEVLTKKEEKVIVKERKEISKVISVIVDNSKKLLEIDHEGLYSAGAFFTRKDYSILRELLTKIHDNILIRVK